MEGAGTRRAGGWTGPGLTGDAGAGGCLERRRPGHRRGRPSVAEAARPRAAAFTLQGQSLARTTAPVGLRLRRGLTPSWQQVRLSRHPWGAHSPPSGLWDPASWEGGQVSPSEVWVQFAGTLALQREPWCLCGRVRARWARGGPRGADCIGGVLCPDPGHPPTWPAEGPMWGHRARP